MADASGKGEKKSVKVPESKLHKEVQDLVKLICDLNMMVRS